MDIVISGITLRTGSTLLQRIFNSRKGTLIWGEHGGLLEYFHTIRIHAKYWSEMSTGERHAYFENNEDSNKWVASMTPADDFAEKAILCSVRAFLESFYSQYREKHDKVGFKEVRYGSEVLELLRRCYPGMKIVLLVRNPIDIWKSMPKDWWNSIFDFTQVYSQRALFYKRFADCDNNVVLFRFEDIVFRDPFTIEQILQLSGISHEHMNDVLSHKLHSSSSPISSEESSYIARECRVAMAQFGYEWTV